MENTELSGDPDSQQLHFFEIGNSHSNSSGITTDLIQRLYMLFSSGELMMQDKKEAHSEEITSPANDRQDEKGNLECWRVDKPEIPLSGFSLVEDEQLELIWMNRDGIIEAFII